MYEFFKKSAMDMDWLPLEATEGEAVAGVAALFEAVLLEAAAAAAAAAKSLEVSATAAPALSLFISKAACIAEKLWESRRLSNAAANCCWRICSARNTPDSAWAEKNVVKIHYF